MGDFPGAVRNVLSQLRAFNVVFLHLGTLFNPDLLLADLRDGLCERGQGVREVTVSDAPRVDADLGETLIVTGFDEAAASEKKCELLGNARAWGIEQMERGASLLLLSRVPKVALLGCAGSQLVTDAKAVFVQPWSEEEQRAVLQRAGIAKAGQDAFIDFSCGLPGLNDVLLDVSSAGLPEAEKRVRAAEELSERIALAVDELGWRVAVALEDKLAREQSMEFDPGRDDPLVVEALRGSGLLAVGDDGRGQFLSTRLRPQAIDAVRRALDGVVLPPGDVTDILAGLWEIERRVRALVGGQARAQHGKGWRASLLDPDVSQRVMDRVQWETALPVDSLSEVANPLDWLTIDELLSLFVDARVETPDRFPTAFWVRARHELVPVRNRSAHFRLPNLDDAETVRRWRSEIIRRLGAGPESA